MNQIEKKAGMREWLGLTILALPALLTSIDVSVMILALPHITTQLGADSVEQLWIMDIYGFLLAGFLITMGTISERIGLRKLLLIGGTTFGFASLLAAFSQSVEMLIVARAILGIAGATLFPTTFALVSHLFQDQKQRSFALGIYMTFLMGGMALGPLVGGAILEYYWWGAIFLPAVPVMVLLLITAPFLLPEVRNPKARQIDLLSVLLSLVTILPVIYGLKEIAKDGFQPGSIIAVIVGIVLGTLFIRRQKQLTNPLLDLRLFSNIGFRVSLGGMFGITLTGAFMLFISQYLQYVQNLSPLQAGLWTLPSVIASMLGSFFAPLIARRIRPAYLIAFGMIISITGMFFVLQLTVTSGLAIVVIAYILFNLGASPLPSLSSGLIANSVPPEKAGAAGSLLQTSGELAFAVGIATIGSLGTAVYRHQITHSIPTHLPPKETQSIQESIAGAVNVAERFPNSIGSDFLNHAYHAFINGMITVSLICGLIYLIVAFIFLNYMRHIPPIGTSQDSKNQPTTVPHNIDKVNEIQI
ncbi:MFS transporter, DHA2 family, multidrug resistance protein [Seinonella peptonophila]|uniref:MFS transporter, DHA2 family, multidrug resistance protein n=1 Tax=Seinonella peptonophila TaxID=112248 RepID=A0A1M4T673_9BACL|nr:MFS transporter [Seinonella peptonophila]SHE40012.1 MFS transporter, DHA2 family, multidrug resistance protein [Seinonella peptonophila]